MIKIICIGNIKDKFMFEGIKEYLKKLKHYTKLEILELKEGSFSEKDAFKNILKEEEMILNKIDNKDYVIGLFINGKQYSSEEFATKISFLESNSRNIIFIIGGSYGLGDNVFKRCDETLSFSKFTFTHQMMRIFLLEQIFRAYKINKNESYHK